MIEPGDVDAGRNVWVTGKSLPVRMRLRAVS
jgi:hypothetical protein